MIVSDDRGGLVDQYTKFLMRFDDGFKVQAEPPSLYPEDGLEIKGGYFYPSYDGSSGYAYDSTSDSYGMINTSKMLRAEDFPDYHPFTIDFWYRPMSDKNSCHVGHEWIDGLFFFGQAGTESDGYGLYFATRRGSFGKKIADMVSRWYHIAIVRKTNSRDVSCFCDGKLCASFYSDTYSLRAKNIDLNRQRDGNNRGSFVIDDFRISNIARWDSDFEPPKRKGL